MAIVWESRQRLCNECTELSKDPEVSLTFQISREGVPSIECPVYAQSFVLQTDFREQLISFVVRKLTLWMPEDGGGEKGGCCVLSVLLGQ